MNYRIERAIEAGTQQVRGENIMVSEATVGFRDRTNRACQIVFQSIGSILEYQDMAVVSSVIASMRSRFQPYANPEPVFKVFMPVYFDEPACEIMGIKYSSDRPLQKQQGFAVKKNTIGIATGAAYHTSQYGTEHMSYFEMLAWISGHEAWHLYQMMSRPMFGLESVFDPSPLEIDADTKSALLLGALTGRTRPIVTQNYTVAPEKDLEYQTQPVSGVNPFVEHAIMSGGLELFQSVVPQRMVTQHAPSFTL
jgi:hypothetical protein